MDDDAARLDGNAAAGVLAEVFAVRGDDGAVTCAGCGARRPARRPRPSTPSGPGDVARCRGCAAVLMRFAEIRDRVVVDLRGAARVELRAAG